MNECFKCGVLGEKALLYDAIGPEGIVKICRSCSFKEKLPLVKKLPASDLEKAELKLSQDLPSEFRSRLRKPVDVTHRSNVYERLVKLSGNKEKKVVVSPVLQEQEASLREIVKEKVKKVFEKDAKPMTGLVDNFHWRILRARKTRKLSQEQLARDIAEPLEMIKIIESGKLLKGQEIIVKKLESYLGIKIRDDHSIGRPMPEDIAFDRHVEDGVTIEDIRRMKEEASGKNLPSAFRPPIELDIEDVEGEFEDKDNVWSKEEKVSLGSTPEGVPSLEKEGKKDLTDKEIDDILFGR